MSAPSNGPRSDNFRRIPIDKIVVGERQRSFDEDWAEAIGGTLAVLGLKKPIEVSADGDGFRLISGRHRLAGCVSAGWTDIPARIVALDDANIEASAALHEAMENLMHNDIKALDRMAHLAAAKRAHDELYPEAGKGGRPKKVTREAEETLPFFGRFSFSREVADRVGLARSVVNSLTTAWEKLLPASRTRLRGSRLANKQGELLALAELEPIAQKLALDKLLADPPEAATVAEAVAKINDQPAPDADERRVTRYADTIARMALEQRDRIFAANEDLVRDFARRRGWLT